MDKNKLPVVSLLLLVLLTGVVITNLELTRQLKESPDRLVLVGK